MRQTNTLAPLACCIATVLVWVSMAGAQSPSRSANQARSAKSPAKPVRERRHPPVVTALAISQDGTHLASGGDDHRVRVWDMASRTLLQTLRGHGDWVQAVGFDPAYRTMGRQLYSAGNDGRIVAWDLERGKGRVVVQLGQAWTDLTLGIRSPECLGVGFGTSLLRQPLDGSLKATRLKSPCRDLRTVQVSPEGSLIAAGGRNGKLRVWSAADGRPIRDIQTHDQPLRALVFTPDAKQIISAGEDRSICVWEIATGDELRHIETHAGRILSAVMLDDHRLAAGTSENKIQIWNVKTGQHLSTLAGHTGSVCALAHRDSCLVSGSFDATIRIWTVPLDASPVAAAVLDASGVSSIRR